MDKQAKLHLMGRIDDKLSELPWYVTEFIDSKKRKLSASTLLNYCHDYIIFFDWLITENFTIVQKRTEIELSTLETLTIRETESFCLFWSINLGIIS